MSYSRNHSKLTGGRRFSDKRSGRITIRYVDPNKKFNLYGKYDPNWVPKVKDYIEVKHSVSKREFDIVAGWRGHITQIIDNEDGSKKYLCTIYNVHRTVFLNREDFNQYFTKEQRLKMGQVT